MYPVHVHYMCTGLRVQTLHYCRYEYVYDFKPSFDVLFRKRSHCKYRFLCIKECNSENRHGFLQRLWCPVVLRNDASREWRHYLIKKYVWQAWCRAVHSWRMEKSTSTRSSGSRMRAPWTTVPQLLASPGAQQSAFRSAYLFLEKDS